MKRVILTLLFVLLLAACGESGIEIPTIEPKLTQPPIPATQIIKPTQSNTPSPTKIPTPNPTLAYLYSICDPFPLIENNKVSPDGQWIAISCEDLNAIEEANAPYVKVVNLDKTIEWTVTLKELSGFNYLSYNNGNGWFPGILLVHHWYKDSRFVFLVPDYVIDGVRTNGWGLYRFDTETGRVSPYLPVASTTYSFAFSHDDEYFIYHYAQENNLVHLVSIETGENTILQTPENAEFVFNFIWSPDDTKIIFEGEGSYEDGMTTLYLFDLFNQIIIDLLEYERYKYIPETWVSESQLVLRTYDKEVTKYIFDIKQYLRQK